MNIIEQEDIVKGLPDAALQMEMQMPSGQVPEFLVLSEIQRRSDMRQRYSAQQPMPTSTVKDQVMAEGLAAMMPISSVPAASSPLSPPLPLGDAQQGLAGTEVQMAAQGGLLGMATGGQFPDLSGDGDVTRKDILMGRGVIPMQEGSITPNNFTSRGDSSFFDGMSSSFTDPNDFFVEAGTQFLIKQNIDPTGYTIQELVDIGSQQIKDYGDSSLPYSVAGSQGEILGDVLKGSMALLGDKIPDLPETNLGASSADRTRRAEEFASELRRRSSALGDSLSEAGDDISEYVIDPIANVLKPRDPINIFSGLGDFLRSEEQSAAQAERKAILDGDDPFRMSDFEGVGDYISNLFSSGETKDNNRRRRQNSSNDDSTKPEEKIKDNNRGRVGGQGAGRRRNLYDDDSAQIEKETDTIVSDSGSIDDIINAATIAGDLASDREDQQANREHNHQNQHQTSLDRKI